MPDTHDAPHATDAHRTRDADATPGALDPRALDATDDLITGRHRDAAGREHDLVTEATAEAAAGTTGGPVGHRHDHVADVPASTGVVTDRHVDTAK